MFDDEVTAHSKEERPSTALSYSIHDLRRMRKPALGIAFFDDLILAERKLELGGWMVRVRPSFLDDIGFL